MDNFEYDEQQKKAIELCCNKNNRIVAITGEAGTGKTTIIKKVYKDLYSERTIYNKDGSVNKIIPNCVVVAPTGKAAKRIYEVTGIPAMTLHRLLEYPMPGEIDQETGKAISKFGPKRDRDNPIDQQIVICDEYAMVNRELHSNLIFALPRGGIVRMFGDNNQLEPIEEGIVLKGQESPFTVALKKFPSVTLTNIHRQKEQSNIIKNAHLINQGIFPKRTDDFKIIFTSQQVQPVDELLNIVRKDPDFYTWKKQIISPTHTRWVGCDQLNNAIQMQRFFGSKQIGISVERHKWVKVPLTLYIGDKIIINKNNYDLGIFNGETGIVKEAYPFGNIVVDFGDRIVTIPSEILTCYRGSYITYNPQRDISLAYVITTHKSQGSEYEEVIYVMDKAVIYNESRRNLYTAITRAKKKVTIITDQRSLGYSLATKTGIYNR